MQIKRKLLFAERMMYTDGKTPFNAVLPFVIKGLLSMQQLENALSSLQALHPLLNASVIIDENGFPAFVTSAERMRIPIRKVDKISENQWNEESIREWNLPFDNKANPLIRLVWICLDGKSEFLLVFSHALCDGKSGLLLLSEFLQLLENPVVELSLERPFETLNDLIPSSVLNKKSNIVKYKIQASAFRILLHLIPLKKNQKYREGDYLLHKKLDKATTNKIIAYCKKEDVTVNTFLGLIILQSFKKIRHKKAFNKITCPVDIRSYLKQLKGNNLFASGMMIVLTRKAKKNESFIDEVKTLQMQSHNKAKKINAHKTLMMFEYAHPLLHRFIDVLKYSKPGNDCMFSNLGNLKFRTQYEGFSLEEIRNFSVIGPLGNPNTILVSTFDDQLDFSFISSENYLPQNEAASIKDEIFFRIMKEINE